MSERFQEPEAWPALWPVLVRCPRCDGRSTLDRARELSHVRLACPACALLREGRYEGGVQQRGEVQVAEGAAGRGRWSRRPRWPEPVTRSYPLWLRTTCCGGRVLWAANAEHLGFLEDYVRAELRERVPEHSGKSQLSWRLPTWMKRAEHRDEVLRGLARMRATL